MFLDKTEYFYPAPPANQLQKMKITHVEGRAKAMNGLDSDGNSSKTGQI
jgi:hypothetical protein